MLENWIKPQIPEEEELDERLHAARSKLSVLQMQIKEHGLPVLVLFEGWGTAGKGSVLGKVIKNIDPRFFKVATMDEPTEEERRKPFLYRYFVKIPANGKLEFLDSGWMDEVVKDVLHDKIGEKEYKKKIESVKRFERQQVNMTNLCNGTTKRIVPEWVVIICEMCGCSANYLFGLED